jgi:hypothetical protein
MTNHQRVGAISNTHAGREFESQSWALSSFVKRIRAEQHLGCEVPDFDPNNGNEAARYLFILEAPGPKAVETGQVSFDNPDQTARNFRDQLEQAQMSRKDIAVWNIVPWYVGNEERTQIRAVLRDEVSVGTEYLKQLLKLLGGLKSEMQHPTNKVGCEDDDKIHAVAAGRAHDAGIASPAGS